MRKVSLVLAAVLAADLASAESDSSTNTSTTTTNSTTTTSTTTTSTTTTTLFSSTLTAAPADYEYRGGNATRIIVANKGGFSIGDEITLTQGGISESSTIVDGDGRRLGAMGGPGAIIVQPRLVNAFTAGAGIAVTSAGAAAPFSAGNDPIATFGKESREFWLPVGKLTPILHTPHVNLLASTFTGSPREQWMDKIVVTNSDGFKLATIEIKKNLNSFNMSAAEAVTSFETISLTPGMSKAPMKEIPKDLPGGGFRYFHRMDVWVVAVKLEKVFKWLPWHIDQKKIGKARREAIIVTTPDVRLLVVSSAAHEYYGPLSYLSVDYAHLDIHIMEMQKHASIRGLLPELWGLQKMSNRTKQLTCPPWSEDGCASQTSSETQFFTI